MELKLECVQSTNKRPSKTKEMRRQAACVIAARMIKLGLIDDENESIEDIVEATQYAAFDDGYKIAKRLEDRHHWDCDMALAEELDGFSGELEKIHEAAEKQWAAENPHEPAFPAGAVVMWRGEPATVHGIYEYRPQCYRIRRGEMGSENSFYIVPFEDVT